MKKFTQLFTAAAFAAGLSVAPAFAQVTTNLKVDVPFNFMVGDKTLSPGPYEVKGPMGSSVLTVRGTDEHSVANIITDSTSKPKGPDAGKLVFHKIGSRYFLASVWNAGGSIGRELPKSRVEREAERASVQTETTYILARNAGR